jgi:hypothetical protein
MVEDRNGKQYKITIEEVEDEQAWDWWNDEGAA